MNREQASARCPRSKNTESYKRLAAEGTRQVKRRIDALLSPSQADQSLEASTETNHVHQAAVDLDQRIQQALYSAGLVTEIKSPVERPRKRRPPINIKGKPLSEAIIEDRR